MKRIKLFAVLFYCICMCVFAISTSFATAPERLNYQGTLTDSNGNRITGTVSMVFNIYDQQTGGSLIWGPETIASAQVNDGLFSVVLGETVPISSSLFSSGSRYISVTVNGEPMSPRQLINSVPYALNGIPSGVIAMWSGSINNIPTGWALCDGLNGTPDLRDRFVVGAGSGYAVAATGGVASINLAHSHTVNDHSHTYSGTTGTSNSSKSEHKGESSYSFTLPTVDHGHSFSGTTSGASNRGTDSQLSLSQSILPPYYALAFIMKL